MPDRNHLREKLFWLMVSKGLSVHCGGVECVVEILQMMSDQEAAKTQLESGVAITFKDTPLLTPSAIQAPPPKLCSLQSSAASGRPNVQNMSLCAILLKSQGRIIAPRFLFDLESSLDIIIHRTKEGQEKSNTRSWSHWTMWAWTHKCEREDNRQELDHR